MGGMENTNPVELLTTKKLVKICAPMVRYSKLPFRMLARKYGCDLAFTPMIICDSFVSSQKARDKEFTTCFGDRPVVVQFATRNGKDLADAAEIVFQDSDGIDVNCGCPQRWAMDEGYGATLINKPELISDMVRQVRNRIPSSDFSVSIKIRLHKDVRHTVEFCRRAECAGVSWIAVHGRTPTQRSEPVDISAIKTINESLRIPVVGNGDVHSLEDAFTLCKQTGVKGVMSARGLLHNPALFSGESHTTKQCIQDWINMSLKYGTSFRNFHQHLMYMLEKSMPRVERKMFNSLCSTSAVIDYLQDVIF